MTIPCRFYPKHSFDLRITQFQKHHHSKLITLIQAKILVSMIANDIYLIAQFRDFKLVFYDQAWFI